MTPQASVLPSSFGEQSKWLSMSTVNHKLFFAGIFKNRTVNFCYISSVSVLNWYEKLDLLCL